MVYDELGVGGEGSGPRGWVGFVMVCGLISWTMAHGPRIMMKVVTSHGDEFARTRGTIGVDPWAQKKPCGMELTMGSCRWVVEKK